MDNLRGSTFFCQGQDQKQGSSGRWKPSRFRPAGRWIKRWGRITWRFYILLSSPLPPNPLFTWTVTIDVPGAFRQNGSLWSLLDSWQMNGRLCRYFLGLCDQHVGVVAKRDSAAEFFSRSSSLVEPFFVAMFCLAQSLVDQVCADQYLPYFTS